MPFLKSRCAQCGKVAESLKEYIIGDKTVLSLKCGHIVQKHQIEQRDAETLCSLDNKQPYPFQRDGIRFLEQAGGRALISDEMGLGKTIQAISFCALHPEVAPVLCILKSTLMTQWAHEWIRWAGPQYVAQIISDSKTPMCPGFKVYIISFDLIRRVNSKGVSKKKNVNRLMDEYLEDSEFYAAENGKEKESQLKKQMNECGIKTIIIDECQQIKNPTSQRTVEVRAICRDIENIICLSGTPIKNNAAEYFPVLNILKPELFPNYSRYIYNYCQHYESDYGTKVGGLSDPKGFLAKTKSFIIRRERSEVLPDLPSISRQFRFCDLSKEVEAAYRDTFKQFEDEYNSQGESHGSFDDTSNILAYLSKMRHLTGLSKIDPCIDFCMEFLGSTDRKLTIFVHHKDVGYILMQKLRDLCADLQLPEPLSLTADLSVDARAGVVDAFMNGSQRILIASTLASGEGLNLQKCSDCIMLERQWNPANEEQAEGRFIRIGQLADAVTATYFVAVGTVDEFFSEIVERKREIVSSTLSGEAVKWDQSSMIKELAEVLAQKGGKRWSL